MNLVLIEMINDQQLCYHFNIFFLNLYTSKYRLNSLKITSKHTLKNHVCVLITMIAKPHKLTIFILFLYS